MASQANAGVINASTNHDGRSVVSERVSIGRESASGSLAFDAVDKAIDKPERNSELSVDRFRRDDRSIVVKLRHEHGRRDKANSAR